jgi:4'-phosphopantetheinyl transferase
VKITQVELADRRTPRPEEIKVWTVLLTAATPTERRLQANAALKKLLASCLNSDPAKLEFTEQPGGKPALAGAELEFNLTHSGAWAMFAISRDTPLGIDLERPRTFPSQERFQRLVRRICNPEEQEAVAASEDPSDCLRRFWVRKEAVVKAEGIGVGAGERLPELDVVAERSGDYSLGDLISPAPGYHAAVAYRALGHPCHT